MKHPYRLLVVLLLFAMLIGVVPAGASSTPTPDRAPRIAVLGERVPMFKFQSDSQPETLARRASRQQRRRRGGVPADRESRQPR